jgi:hypothetical protein
MVCFFDGWRLWSCTQHPDYLFCMAEYASAHWLVPASQLKGDSPLLPALVIPEVPDLRMRHLGPKSGPFSFFLLKDVKRAANERWGSVQAAERERALRAADAKTASEAKQKTETSVSLLCLGPVPAPRLSGGVVWCGVV